MALTLNFMKKYRFYKEIDNWFGEKWYVDLPNWAGSKSALEMVEGADIMLDFFSEGTNEVWLYISESEFPNSSVIEFQNMADDIGEGAYYLLKQYEGKELNHKLWLCNVTLFVFNEKFPERIYLSKVN